VAWPDHVKVAVNLSTIQLTDALFGIVANALQWSGLAATRLEVEITESVLMKDIGRNAAIFQRLQDAGVWIVLDDFGVGYSSLNYLTMMRFDKIKIDKSFTLGLTDNPGCKAAVAAILTLARQLDMVVTAEGVETSEQVMLLRETGVDQLQGYLFARPGAAADLNFLPVDLRRAVVAA
jgi:EAL domain-containing protein (putative c-di-GMP-specific phosphodiesterase class I)